MVMELRDGIAELNVDGAQSPEVVQTPEDETPAISEQASGEQSPEASTEQTGEESQEEKELTPEEQRVALITDFDTKLAEMSVELEGQQMEQTELFRKGKIAESMEINKQSISLYDKIETFQMRRRKLVFMPAQDYLRNLLTEAVQSEEFKALLPDGYEETLSQLIAPYGEVDGEAAFTNVGMIYVNGDRYGVAEPAKQETAKAGSNGNGNGNGNKRYSNGDWVKKDAKTGEKFADAPAVLSAGLLAHVQVTNGEWTGTAEQAVRKFENPKVFLSEDGTDKKPARFPQWFQAMNRARYTVKDSIFTEVEG